MNWYFHCFILSSLSVRFFFFLIYFLVELIFNISCEKEKILLEIFLLYLYNFYNKFILLHGNTLSFVIILWRKKYWLKVKSGCPPPPLYPILFRVYTPYCGLHDTNVRNELFNVEPKACITNYNKIHTAWDCINDTHGIVGVLNKF